MTKMEQPTSGNDMEPAPTAVGETKPDPRAERSVSRRYMLMGVSLLAVSGFTFARSPKRQNPKIDTNAYEALFPRDFGDWHALPAADLILPPESDLANRLYEHILTRSYRNSAGDIVMFLAAYSSIQIDDVQLHRPEVCYSVSGFTIASNTPYNLKISNDLDVPARVVVARSTLRSETILYWTRVGEKFPLNWTSQRMAMLEANLKGVYPDGILVRASVIATGKDDIATLSRFYRDLTEHAQAHTKRLMYAV